MASSAATNIPLAPYPPHPYQQQKHQKPQNQRVPAATSHASLNSVSSSNPCVKIASDRWLAATNVTPDPRDRRVGPLLVEIFETSGSSSRRVAVGRGNPSLGSSVESTCLDVLWPSRPTTTSDNRQQQPSNSETPPIIVTGVNTGALYVHSSPQQPNHSWNANDTTTNDPKSSNNPQVWKSDALVAPRHSPRPSTSVAGRPGHTGQVALGLTTNNPTNSGMSSSGAATTNAQQHQHQQQQQAAASGNSSSIVTAHHPLDRRTALRSTMIPNTAASMTNAYTNHHHHHHPGTPAAVLSSDAFGVLLWNVEHTTNRNTASHSTHSNTRIPQSQYAHQQAVTSLAWMDANRFWVGTEQAQCLPYDVRTAGSSSNNNAAIGSASAIRLSRPGPVRVAVPAQQQNESSTDDSRLLATLQPSVVQLWDVRNVNQAVADIKLPPIHTKNANSNSSSGSSNTSNNKFTQVVWGHSPNSIILAVDHALYEYDISDTRRPILQQYNYAPSPCGSILDIALMQQQPQQSTQLRRAWVTTDDGLRNMSLGTAGTPLDISPHNALTIGWGEMLRELPLSTTTHDVAQLMQDRVVAGYSMDCEVNRNILLLQQAHPKNYAMNRVWEWIHRVESLMVHQEDFVDGTWVPASLVQAGAGTLFDSATATQTSAPATTATVSTSTMPSNADETVTVSATYGCSVYDSPARRSAWTCCGWAVGEFSLPRVLEACEEQHEFERAAALAVWHENISTAVEILQRGSTHYRNKTEETESRSSNSSYSEVLDLVALAISGYHGREAMDSIWKRTCANLLQRPEFSSNSGNEGGEEGCPSPNSQRVACLRSMLKFLMSLGTEDSPRDVLTHNNLSLCDRVGFACRFLSMDDCSDFVKKSIRKCQELGDIEGITITGIEKEGIQILQAYVDRYSDVQTAALVTSRVILPSDWSRERQICGEWLSAYRTLLNRWQMWQHRAAFDVDRSDHLRKLKQRQAEPTAKVSRGGRAVVGGRKGSRLLDPDVQASAPAQIEARCNYCSAPLSLSKQTDAHSKTWLSKMKPVLPCCAQCRKPLPRCAICMLSLGTLNPYAELGRSTSTLGNLPFAEWFTWCMSCGHGGHNHHLVGWFNMHEECPVNGCSCRCQFDDLMVSEKRTRCNAIKQRPASKPEQESYV